MNTETKKQYKALELRQEYEALKLDYKRLAEAFAQERDRVKELANLKADHEALQRAFFAVRNERDALRGQEDEPSLVEQLADERTHADMLAAILRLAEWGGSKMNAGGYTENACPRCGQFARKGHDPGCEIARVLASPSDRFQERHPALSGLKLQIDAMEASA